MSGFMVETKKKLWKEPVTGVRRLGKDRDKNRGQEFEGLEMTVMVPIGKTGDRGSRRFGNDRDGPDWQNRARGSKIWKRS